MRRASGEPGELVGDFEALVVDPLGESGIAAERQRRDAPAAVWEVRGDLHAGGREREVAARLATVAAEVSPQLVDEVAPEVGRERGEDPVAPRGARPPSGGDGKGPDPRGLL